MQSSARAGAHTAPSAPVGTAVTSLRQQLLQQRRLTGRRRRPVARPARARLITARRRHRLHRARLRSTLHGNQTSYPLLLTQAFTDMCSY